MDDDAVKDDDEIVEGDVDLTALEDDDDAVDTGDMDEEASI